MDYRHTEDFARQMEAATRRAHALRREAMASFVDDFARWLLTVSKRLIARVRRGQRRRRMVGSGAAHPTGQAR